MTRRASSVTWSASAGVLDVGDVRDGGCGISDGAFLDHWSSTPAWDARVVTFCGCCMARRASSITWSASAGVFDVGDGGDGGCGISDGAFLDHWSSTPAWDARVVTFCGCCMARRASSITWSASAGVLDVGNVRDGGCGISDGAFLDHWSSTPAWDARVVTFCGCCMARRASSITWSASAGVLDVGDVRDGGCGISDGAFLNHWSSTPAWDARVVTFCGCCMARRASLITWSASAGVLDVGDVRDGGCGISDGAFLDHWSSTPALDAIGVEFCGCGMARRDS